MKRNVILSLSLIVIGSFAYLPVALGRYPAETQWGLPEGAIARLGKGRITEVQYSPDGMRLAVASNIGIWVYDAETRGPLKLLSGHTDRVSSVSYSGTGNYIASGSEDETVRVWDAMTGKLLHILTGHTGSVLSVSYSGTGTHIASGSEDEAVRVWDATTGKLLHTLTGHTDRVLSVSYSGTGTHIASGGGWPDDKTVRVWDATTGKLLHTLTGHSDDGTVLLWDLAPDTLRQR